MLPGHPLCPCSYPPHRIYLSTKINGRWYTSDQHVLSGMYRHLLQSSAGTMPHAHMLRAHTLYGTVVAPAVRKAMA